MLKTSSNDQIQHVCVKSCNFGNQNEFTMVQISNVPENVIFSENNAMKLFFNLINSVIYHELKNPLSSLVA